MPGICVEITQGLWWVRGWGWWWKQGKTVLELIATAPVRGTWRIFILFSLYYINMCENIHNKTLSVLDSVRF